MAKKLGRTLLFGALIGAAAVGAYHYLQSKDKDAEEFDDFDDLDDLTEDEAEASRNYVKLDSAKDFVTGTVEKAKDAVGKASKKIMETIDEFKAEKADNENDDDSVEDVTDTLDSEETSEDESAK